MPVDHGFHVPLRASQCLFMLWYKDAQLFTMLKCSLLLSCLQATLLVNRSWRHSGSVTIARERSSIDDNDDKCNSFTR